MIELKTQSHNDSVEIWMGVYKYLLGPNIESKQNFIDNLKKVFFKVDPSDFAYENDLTSVTLINDKSIKLNRWKFYEVNNHLNLTNELSIHSKTMMIQYLEAITKDIEITEEVNTINILLEQVSEVLSEKILKFNDISIYPKFQPINQKQLIKLLELTFVHEELKMNTLDLDYEAKILFQLEMIKKISEENELFSHLVIVDIPKITQNIKKSIENIDMDNIFILIMTDESIDTDIQNCIYFGENVVDFANEIKIYNEILMVIDRVYTMDEIKPVIKEFVMGVDSEVSKKLENIL